MESFTAQAPPLVGQSVVLSMILAQDLTGTGVAVNVVRPGGKVDPDLFPGGGEGRRLREGFLSPDVLNPLIIWLLSGAEGSADGGSMSVCGTRLNPRTKLPKGRWRLS